MQELSGFLNSLPADPDFLSTLKFIAIFAGIMLLLGGVGRMILGKRSGLNHAISSAMGILSIYALTVVVYTFDPYDLARWLAPLPFVSFEGEVLKLFSFEAASFASVCSQVLSMVILAFLVNLLDSILPKGEKIYVWYIWRFVTVVLAMALHYLVSWAFNAFLPGVLIAYAPTILLGILVAMLAMGLLNVILGLVLTVVNPIFGALYGFFFSNVVGKQLGKAVLTTILLCCVVYALNFLGFSVVSISAGALQAYIPLIGALLVLWFITGHIF